MASPTPYIHFPGTAREALTFYADVFGGSAELNTFADFGRTDGPADAVAHGMLDGPVTLFGADVSAPPRRPRCAPGSTGWPTAVGSRTTCSAGPGARSTARSSTGTACTG